MIRGKFLVSRIEITTSSCRIRTTDDDDYERDESGHPKSKPCELRTIFLVPVYGNNAQKHENSRFWDCSPSGEIRLGMMNPDAWGAFEIGKACYFDFTSAGE